MSSACLLNPKTMDSNVAHQKSVNPSPASDVRVGCTFDLNFSVESSQEDSLSQIDDAKCGRVSSFPENMFEQGNKSSRKRKMDREGFVTPATPDIPRSSLKYGLPSHSLFDEYNVKDEIGPAGDAESEDPVEHFHGNQVRQDTKNGVEDNDVKTEEEDAGTRAASDNDDTMKRYDDVSDLFEDVAQETKMFLIQLAQSFRESEEFEGQCVSELGNLAEEAKELEEKVSRQKDLLRQRLAMIGQRLEQSD